MSYTLKTGQLDTCRISYRRHCDQCARRSRLCLISSVLAFAKSVDAFTHASNQFSAVSKFSNEDKKISRRRRIANQSCLQVIPSGLEDIIFNTQNAASTLANTVINGDASTVKSLPLLYTAGLWTSFSPCSLGLLPITVSYITAAANERRDKNTTFPTMAFALGLALVFTALGVSASMFGGVFGNSGDALSSLLLAAVGSLVSVLMGLQLLELIEIPLPSLDLGLRSSVLENGKQSDSLFDANGGVILQNLSSSQVQDTGSEDLIDTESTDEFSLLLRTFLLGGTSALVASPCATPVLASLLAYLALASTSTSENEVVKGAVWMLAYTLGYSTPLLVVGATGGQALVNLQSMKSRDGMNLFSWITPLTGGVLIMFGFNGFLVALLGDPSLAGLAPIIE
ncbi:hypothetical protein ACHAWO_007305 [Cyclotella atomus]|uniref:Cytochrome C biogenesis protein transmembrane domain-containing protein n=1 Tax=Cyclotella atomus TaxID=382360 RepID=A0ABD3Q7H8_9STRA